MLKRYVIKNIITGLYWYGFYTSGKWSDDIRLAKVFDYKEQAEEYIDGNLFDEEEMIFEIVKIYCFTN